MPRPLEEAVIVITGASSGVGRASALRFARMVLRGTVLVPHRSAPVVAADLGPGR